MKKIDSAFYLVLSLSVLWGVMAVVSLSKIWNPDSVSEFIATLELIILVFLVVFSVKIYQNCEKTQRRFFLWLLIANLADFLNSFFFYLLIYIGKTPVTNIPFLGFMSYFIFFLIWLGALTILLFKILVPKILQLRSFIKVFILFFIVNLIVISLFFLSARHSTSLSSVDLSLDFSCAYRLILFDLALLCLICAKDLGMQFFLSGIIVLISAAFLLDYSTIGDMSDLLIYGELFWFAGILLMFFGTFFIYRNKSYDVNSCFRTTNAVKSQLVFWTFGISIVSFLVFFIIAYTFKLVSSFVFVGLPFFLMIYSVIVVLLSAVMGAKFEAQFKKLTGNIDALMLQNDKSKMDNAFTIDEFIFLQHFIVDAFEFKEERVQVRKKLGQVAAQVAHDIRSPLAALNASLKHLPEIPENQRISMRNAANRINDIANNLLQRYKTKGSDKDSKQIQLLLLAPVLESIISEKRLQYEDQPIELEENITSEGFVVFSKFDPNKMKRLLSNLINNAVEALPEGRGKIQVMLDADKKHIFLKIKDNGCGIPEDKLGEVLEPGVSFKEGGSGLGLSYAKETVEAWRGILELESIVNQGTTVNINLPRAKEPEWFTSEIVLSPRINIGILDDDQSIHDAWDECLLEVSKNLKIFHFKTPDLFSEWYRKQIQPVWIFSDYELLGENKSGLDVMEELSISENAMLVTSHYENPQIIRRCQALGVYLLPKNLFAYIHIRLAS